MMADSDNATKQAEEIEALQAIYGDELRVTDSGAFEIRLELPDLPATNASTSWLTFEFSLPESYPSSSEAPRFTIRAPWLSRADDERLREALLQQHREAQGDGVLFTWLEWLKECPVFLNLTAGSASSAAAVAATTTSSSSSTRRGAPTREYDIKTGTAVTDRKSKFQAHYAVVHSELEAREAVEQLKSSNKKIATATHNISAYRIVLPSGEIMANRDDDGEGGAGDKLLYLLERAGVTNLVVIVTRWYGGIMLGPDRFKHIVNVAQTLLQEHALINTTGGAAEGASGSSSNSSRGKPKR